MATDTIRKCSLYCEENSHAPIKLPDKEIVALGRGPETKITNSRCSRHQVHLVADCHVGEVTVTQIGPNTSAVNGVPLHRNESRKLKDGDTLELLLGEYIHKIKFDPPFPKSGASVKAEKKDVCGKREFDEVECSKDRKDEVNVAKKKKGAKLSDFGFKHMSKKNGVNPQDSGAATEDLWETIDNGKLLVFTTKGVEGRYKIASYDVDGTIIVTKSGRVFAKDNDDWKIALSEIQPTLKRLWTEGYKIVFFTNQAGIARGKVKPEDFKSKIECIVKKISVPVQVFVSTGKGIYRKPAPGMWNVLTEMRNDGVEVSVDDSFYCGDAAGREENWAPKKKKDFSCSDRLFALNIGLRFCTPEEHFLSHKAAKYNLPSFNPASLRSDVPICDPSDAQLVANEREVIVMVGFPGSGKSFVATKYIASKGYVHVNRDQLKSWQKCVSLMEDSLARKKSVVVDNTNPDKESRQRYTAVAKKHKVPARCFLMNTTLEHAKHNNKFRGYTDDTHMQINDMVLNSYKSKYEEPSLEEGFNEIVRINFVPKFENPDHEKLYRMYLMEK